MFSRVNFLIGRKGQASIIRLVFSILFVISLGSPIYGQFSSGSTGADGTFSPTANTTLQVPESGVFNFTTINIPQNITVNFTKNSKNTPVTVLATGNVVISGQILVNGGNGNGRFGGIGGPGGGNGGIGGSPLDSINGTSGDGPGGGTGAIGGTTGVGQGGGGGFINAGANGSFSGNGIAGIGGTRYGTKVLLPLIGGSGGGGGGSQLASSTFAGGGGGGGGAILIASSTSISFPTTPANILANGGSGGAANTLFVGGGGSGGAIRIVSNIISGSPCLQVNGTGASGPAGSNGIVRVEAFDLSQYVPRCSTFEQTLGNPNPVTLPNTPTLRITSVGGIASPTNPIASSSTVNPDIVVPTTIQNPVQVAIQASNLAVGTVLQVRLTPESGTPILVNSTPLAGTLSSSTATASVTLPTTGISVIRAFVTVDAALAFAKGNTFINGEKVSKVEYSSGQDGKTEVTYILDSGKRITEIK